MSGPTLREFATREELFEAAAEAVLQAGRRALKARGVFHLVLSGGSTPRGLYSLLRSREDFDWSRTHFWWGDERCVPPEHDDSNFRMAWACWLQFLKPSEDHLHRMRGELGAAAGAEDYADQLSSVFGESQPIFDLVLLGLGEDGHTASLFPGRPEAADRHMLVTPARAPDAPRERISLGLAPLTTARKRLFLVAGRGKHEALRALSSAQTAKPGAFVAHQSPTEVLYTGDS